jgi:hypothetical protein
MWALSLTTRSLYLGSHLTVRNTKSEVYGTKGERIEKNSVLVGIPEEKISLGKPGRKMRR